MIDAQDRPEAEAVADIDAAAVAFLAAAAPEAPIVYVMSEDAADEVRSKATKAKGKGSRWNSVRHGCMAQTLIPADLQGDVDRWTVILTERHCPTNDFEVKVIARLGRISAQLERTEKMKVIDLQRTMDRATLVWDEDRGIYIDMLVERLEREPGVARALVRSKQGVIWMLSTWQGLADNLAILGRWTDEQIGLVMNLKGIRPELRDGYRTEIADSTAEELAQIVTDEVSDLHASLERSLNSTDWAEQSMAAAGMPMEEDQETKRLRKQETRLKLDYRRAEAELDKSRADAAAAAAAASGAAGPAPAPPAAPTPVVASVPKGPDEESGPRPRPWTSNAGFNFLNKRSMLLNFELPATATAPRKTVGIRLPFPGGDPEPELAPEDDAEADTAPDPDPVPEPEPEPEPVSHNEPAAAERPRACVASNAAKTQAAKDRREQERRKHRAQEKKARKAARRNRR